MPIKIPNDLPAFEKLQQEGVRLIAENEACARTSGRCRWPCLT